MLEAQEELRSHDPLPQAPMTPREKVKEKMKERRDKQRSPGPSRSRASIRRQRKAEPAVWTDDDPTACPHTATSRKLSIVRMSTRWNRQCTAH